MTKKISICKIKDFPKSGRLTQQIEELSILIFKNKKEFFAIENKCPHVGAPLTNSILTPNSLICDWHAWEFELSNGKCLNSEENSCFLKMFKIYKNENEDLILELEK